MAVGVMSLSLPPPLIKPFIRREKMDNSKKETDNWKHRSNKMKCNTCMWYIEKRGSIGRCRKKSPTLNGWPVVFISDWCGKHKLDENIVQDT